MSLSPKHIPLSHPLREQVLERFAPQDGYDGEDALSREQLIAFLAKSKDTDSSPMATIKRRAAKENQRPLLRPEDKATLVWVCEAFEDWEDHYPLEQPLKDHIRRLLPLAVAMALKDDAFYTPGAHALHRLLDALQNGAVGWQVRLDRAGQMLEQRIQRSVEKALDWFDNKRIDITTITQELRAANERDVARAQRMVQRLEETEEARLKTLASRRDAAADINEGLNKYELPAAIGEFLKGPWYDSAQLVLVKHGIRSREWEQMRRATVHLMESVQSPTHTDDTWRDRQEQILRHLPAELRRWLVSLEHDSDATDSAIGLVEYAHLRIQHGQKLQLVRIPAIPVEAQVAEPDATDDEQFRNGDWYRFEDDGELRAQLVLQLENRQHLLFTNFVGLKALDLSRSVFSQRLHDGFSAHLPDRDTFSLSLAAAAGIDSEERLRQLTDPDYKAVDASPVAAEEPSTEPESTETVDSADAQLWTDELPDLSDSDEFDPVLTPPEGAETEASHELELELDEPEPEAQPASFHADKPVPAAVPESPEASPFAPAASTEPETEPETPSATPVPSAPFTAPMADPATPAEPENSGYAAPEPRVPSADTPGITPPAPVSDTPVSPATTPTWSAAQPEAEKTAPATQTTTQTTTPTPPPVPSQPVPAPMAAPVEAPSVTQATPVPPQQPYAPAPPPPIPEQAPPPNPVAAPTPAPPPASPPTASTPAPPETPPPLSQPLAPPTRSPEPAPEPPPAPEPAAPISAPPPSPAPPPPPAPAAPPAPAPPPVQATVREIDVPMGAWLGFHDGETPIMAKLAVFDPRRDNYIFVNRKGIAMRELSRSELRTLMDQGLVDILETRSYFRDEVERAREEGQ